MDEEYEGDGVEGRKEDKRRGYLIVGG